MLKATRDIIAHAAKGWDFFSTDERSQQAIMNRLTIVGECAANITDATAASLPSLVVHEAVGMRNIIVHRYWEIDLETVWDTIIRDLPRLETEIIEALGHYRIPET